MARGPGVIIGRKGSLGTTFFSEGDYWPHDTTLWVRDFHGNVAMFTYYFLKTLGLERYDAGASNPSLNRNHVHKIEVRWPGREIQERISEILSAYDALIANNLRRIQLVEQMAKAIYREWFVYFRFPGHEGAARAQASPGPIPESWETRPLGEVCDIQDGDWIETKDQGGADYRLVQISNIGVGMFVEAGKYRFISQETFDRLRCSELRNGDILIARMPTPIGRAWLVSEMPWRMVTAVDVAIVRTDPARCDAAFLAAQWNDEAVLDRLAKQASGTTRPRITRREMAAFDVLLPPVALQLRFGNTARNHLALIECLRRQAANLRAMRDLLLPRLMSGQLTLPVAEAAIPAAL